MNGQLYPDSFDACNPEKVERLHKTIQEDVDYSLESEGKPYCFKTMSKYSVRLPPLSEFPEEFAQEVSVRIIDRDMKDELEMVRAINWCRTTKPLLPLQTVGDGNCLLHAVSLALWGIQDVGMFLRRLLYITLVNDQTNTFKKRWRRERGYVNEHVPGLRFSTMDWREEWEMVLRLSDDTPQDRPNDLMYSSLEEIHLFVLANVLRRPIIVLADQMVRSFNGLSMQPDSFGGIYLPLHWEPSKCWKNPVVLGYNKFHFTPLVGSHDPFQKTLTATESQHAIPLVHHDQTSLQLHFLLQDEENKAHSLLKSYLKVSEVVLTRQDGVNEILVAELSAEPLPEESDVVRDFIQLCERLYRVYLGNGYGNPQQKTAASVEKQPTIPRQLVVNTIRSQYGGIRCVTKDCPMTGLPNTANMCSKCFAEFTKRDSEEETAKQRAPKEPSAPLSTVEPLDENTLLTSVAAAEALSIPGSDRSQVHMFLSRPEDNLHPCVSPLCKGIQMCPDVKLCLQCVDSLKQARPEDNSTNDLPKNEGIRRKPEDQSELFGVGGTVNRPPTSTFGCQTPGCSRTGKEEQQSMCAQCFMKAPSFVTSPTAPASREEGAYQLVNEPIREPKRQNDLSYFPQSLLQMSYDVDQTPAEMHAMPRRTFKCNNPACHETGYEHMKGLCSRCFYHIRAEKEAQKAMASSKASKQCSEQSTSKVAQVPQLDIQIRKEIQRQDSVADDQMKNFCSTPGCEGIRLKNPHEMCHFCYHAATHGQAVKANKSSTAECRNGDLKLSTQGAGVISTSGTNEAGGLDSEHLVESRAEPITSLEVIVSDDQRRKCASPVCGNLVFPPRNLCDACVQTLTQAAVKVGQGKCKNKDCEFHGSPEWYGYCSRCFQAVSVAEANERRPEDIVKKPQTAPVAQLALAERPPQYSAPVARKLPMESQARPHTAPIAVKGKPCKTPDCTRYGDPAMAELCTKCYRTKFPICQAGTGYDMVAQPPFTQLYQQSKGPSVSTSALAGSGASKKAHTNLVTSETSMAYQPGVSVMYQQPSTFNFQQVPPPTEPSHFDMAMFRVASSRKANRCKNSQRGCDNFGSPGRQGYCTSCYNDLRGEDVVDSRRIVGLY